MDAGEVLEYCFFVNMAVGEVSECVIINDNEVFLGVCIK